MACCIASGLLLISDGQPSCTCFYDLPILWCLLTLSSSLSLPLIVLPQTPNSGNKISLYSAQLLIIFGIFIQPVVLNKGKRSHSIILCTIGFSCSWKEPGLGGKYLSFQQIAKSTSHGFFVLFCFVFYLPTQFSRSTIYPNREKIYFIRWLHQHMKSHYVLQGEEES